MNFQDSLEKMKSFQEAFLNFIEKEEDSEEHYQNLIQLFNPSNIGNDKYELKSFLYIILHVSKNHYRCSNFLDKINQIFQFLKEKLQQQFSNFELFNFFKSSKPILLFLIKEKIINIDETIYKILTTYKYVKSKYHKFFYPEIEPFIKKDLNEKNDIKKDLHKRYDRIFLELETNKIPDDFEIKRKNGENDNEICEIIRKDLIEKFIIYINKNDISLTTMIKSSIYETNSFLLKRQVLITDSYMSLFDNEDNPTLIEYASFFGAIQIVKYLYKNNVELSQFLWIYAIHGDNPELIHFLEENNINIDSCFFNKCLKESIKCHHNDITNYILNKYDDLSISDEDLLDFCFHYHNISYFPANFNNDYCIFLFACKYDYFQIVEFFLKTKKIDLNQEKINIDISIIKIFLIMLFIMLLVMIIMILLIFY